MCHSGVPIDVPDGVPGRCAGSRVDCCEPGGVAGMWCISPACWAFSPRRSRVGASVSELVWCCLTGEARAAGDS